MSKFENFPKLKEGDLVVCGQNNGFLVTSLGAYEVRSASHSYPEIVGNTNNLLSILELNTDYTNDFYIPQAVFRPHEGRMLTWMSMTNMLQDYRNCLGTYNCVWCKERDEVKELTVDEVSELLGYKVKIIGKENK